MSEKEEQFTRFDLIVPKTIADNFTKTCEKIGYAPSKVLMALMYEFIDRNHPSILSTDALDLPITLDRIEGRQNEPD